MENAGTRSLTLRPVSPGKTLEAEMKIRNLSANALALKLQVPANRISDILRNRRAISAETALRLGKAFGTSGDFWFNLQKNYDLSLVKKEIGKKIDEEVDVIT